MSVMSNGPGVSQSFGTTTPQNRSEFLQAGGVTGALGYAPIGNDGVVSFGPGYGKRADAGRAGGPSADSRAVYPVSVAQQFWYQMDDFMFNEWTDEVQRGLTYDVGRNPSVLQQEWDKYTQAAGSYNKATGQSVSPIEFLRMQNDRLERIGKLPQQGGSGSGSSSVVNLTNPSDARALVDNALSSYLGRAATTEEAEQFLGVLNAQERANPINTTKSSRSGGVNTQQVAKDFARSQEGAAEFMADTQYMDWFMNKITGDPTKEIASGL